MKDSHARDSLNAPRRMSRFVLLVLDAPCIERNARCGERTGSATPLLERRLVSPVPFPLHPQRHGAGSLAMVKAISSLIF